MKSRENSLHNCFTCWLEKRTFSLGPKLLPASENYLNFIFRMRREFAGPSKGFSMHVVHAEALRGMRKHLNFFRHRFVLCLQAIWCTLSFVELESLMSKILKWGFYADMSSRKLMGKIFLVPQHNSLFTVVLSKNQCITTSDMHRKGVAEIF